MYCLFFKLQKSHRLKGYGFVSYFNDEAGYMAAQRALTELHETSLDDVTYKCELSNIIDAPPPAVPYSPHTGGMPLSPHHQLQGMGLSSGAVQEYDFDVSQHQCSYYDDYDGNTSAETSLYQQPQTSAAGVYDTVGFPEPSPAPPIRALSTSLSSNSGFDGAPIPSSAPAIRGLAASLSTGSETFSLSLDNDIGSSPTATALEIRAPSTMQVEDVRSPYILSPSLTSAAAGGAHAQGSYQITAPSGASAGFPVARQQNNAPRSFQYGQQQQQYGAQFPTQYPAQYASQSRYQAGNRDGGIYAQQPPQQMQQHMQGGVASYNAPPQQQQQPYNPRRAVGGHSSLSAQAPYWQPPLQQQQGGPYGAPPQHQHQHNPRMAHNGYMPQQQQHQRYEQRPQYAGHSHQQQQGQYQGQQQHFNQHQQVPPQHPLQGNYAPRPHQPIYARAPPPAPSLSLSLPGEYHHSQAPSSGSPSPLPLPTGCSQLRNGQQQNLQQPGSHHSRNPSFEHSPSLPGSAPSSGNNSLSAPTSAPRTFFNDLSLVDSALGEGLGLNPAEPLGLGHGSLDSALLDGFGAGLSEI